MRTSARLGLALGALEDRPLDELVHLAQVAEVAEFELLLVPEAWGRDAFVVLGHLAARTERIRLGTGIVNVYSRTPALLAMAAATLDEASGGRAVLGLGTSGRAVVEGWHGVPMARPLARLRETTEAVRAVLRRERRGFEGEVVRIAPAFRLTFRTPRDRIPIWHASLTPRAIRQCGEVADGWMPTMLGPAELATDLAHALDGLRRAGRERGSFTVAPLIPALVSEDLPAARAAIKRHLAFYVGGMGNFYHDVVARHGYADAADRIASEWAAGRRDGAAAAVPDELVDALALVGPAERCASKLAEYRAAGADLPIAYLPAGTDVASAETTIRALGRL